MNGTGIGRLSPKGARPIIGFFRGTVKGVRDTFEPNGIAIAPDGTIFADTFAGNGWTNTSALIELSRNGHIRVLWKS